MSAPTLMGDVKPVEARHSFDEARLEDWMTRHIAGFSGPLRVAQFKGGQSNPTFLIQTPDHAYVLRRKPLGKLLPSAHAVDREYRVISALYPTGFPVAKPHALCQDDEVLGSAFYVMDHAPGRIFWNGGLPEAQVQERRAIYEAQTTTLAQLHGIDPADVGLSDYGKPGNYFVRQIDRWTKQYRASETGANDLAEKLIAFLPSSAPAQDRVSIVHGDYRLDNFIFSPDAPKIIATLDWELSTIGDPLADFTYFLMSWIMPADGRSGLAGLDIKALGIPSVQETVALYCELTGRTGLPHLDWYFSYNLFRLMCIIQGIAGRVRDGTAASAQAQEMITRIKPLSEAAWAFAKRAGA